MAEYETDPGEDEDEDVEEETDGDDEDADSAAHNSGGEGLDDPMNPTAPRQKKPPA